VRLVLLVVKILTDFSSVFDKALRSTTSAVAVNPLSGLAHCSPLLHPIGFLPLHKVFIRRPIPRTDPIPVQGSLAALLGIGGM